MEQEIFTPRHPRATSKGLPGFFFPLSLGAKGCGFLFFYLSVSEEFLLFQPEASYRVRAQLRPLMLFLPCNT